LGWQSVAAIEVFYAHAADHQGQVCIQDSNLGKIHYEESI
jgi:hypothetical protein